MKAINYDLSTKRVHILLLCQRFCCCCFFVSFINFTWFLLEYRQTNKKAPGTKYWANVFFFFLLLFQIMFIHLSKPFYRSGMKFGILYFLLFQEKKGDWKKNNAFETLKIFSSCKKKVFFFIDLNLFFFLNTYGISFVVSNV